MRLRDVLPLGRVTCGAVLLASVLAATTAATAQQIVAVRANPAPLRLDGRLTEPVWSQAAAATGFLQRAPLEGQPAPEATEVRFAFDGDALWIGARMHSADPAGIRALVTRRDRESTSEQIVVSLDTHRDRRTAYSFGVTPAGVRIDYFHAGDDEEERDYGYDPVWQAAVSIDSLGWTAEMRIPFTQLRFNPAREHVWGVNLARYVPARNESSYWILVRRSEVGWASRMGTLAGIRDVEPSRRIELLPYVATNARLSAEVDKRDPFAKSREAAARLGADVKVGLGPNMTLDATINPDFGQVEADPAQVNLTAYETFFDERRPFFTEGAELLDARGLFYSRRIGGPPPGDAGGDFAQTRDNTTILGAAKLSGRTPSRLSLAALGAVTDREEVRTYDTTSATFGRSVIAPRAAYFVASAQQELGRDNSTIGAAVTSVQRGVGAGTPLSDLVPRSAYSALLDGRLRWAGGAYDVNVFAAFTHVRGDSSAILRLQRSSRRYWQRPDAEHVAIEPARRTLGGYMLGVGHSKMAGAHWLWNADYFSMSPAFEPNDMGAWGAVDSRELSGDLEYRETQPGRWYQRYWMGVEQEAAWNFEGIRRHAGASAYFNVILPNFWRVGVDASRTLRNTSDRLTRGGPLMGTGSGWRFDVEVENSDGARTQWDLEGSAESDELGGSSFEIEGSLSARPSDRLEVSIDPGWSHGVDPRQYIMTAPDGRPETFGSRYVFARVERHEIATRFRVNFTVTPELTLETYAEPFASSGVYSRFGELLAPRSRDLLVYGEGGTTITRRDDGSHEVTAGASTFTIEPEDFNVLSFRSNVVLRWEWRPGSTLFFVWQQDGFAERDPARVRPNAVFDALGVPGDTFVALKLSYWIPVR